VNFILWRSGGIFGKIYAMKDKIRNFLLRTLPYAVSIAGGIILFSVSLDNVRDPAVEGLISNISASLLAIPLVFLLYDYTTTRVSRRLQETLVAGMTDKINTIMLHVIVALRKMLKSHGHLTRRSVNAMRALTESHIARELSLRGEYVDLLHQYYEELENLIIGYGKENVFSPEQLRIMTALTRDMSRMVGAHRLGGGRRMVARHIKNIIDEITDWLDSTNEIAKNFDQILTQIAPAKSPDDAKNTK